MTFSNIVKRNFPAKRLTDIKTMLVLGMPIVALSGGTIFLTIFVVVIALFIVLCVVAFSMESKKRASMTPEELAKYDQENAMRAREAAARATEFAQTAKWGALNAQMHCPHCQTRGKIHTMRITTKKGISGAKATGALLTGGISMLATGLSRKEQCTQAHCDACGSTWTF